MMASDNDRPLKILIVTTGRIRTPRSGGELRTRHLAGELARLGHVVEVLSLVARNYPTGEELPTARLTLRERHSLWLDLALLADRLRLIPITELPRWLAHERISAHTAGEHTFDIIQYEFPWFAYRFGATAAGARVIYSAHNIESDYWQAALARYPLGGWFHRRLIGHEIHAIRTASGVAACSEADRRWMIGRAGVAPEKIQLVPNGFDAGRIGRPDAETRNRLRQELEIGPEERLALFIGSDTPANREAAQAIITTIAPALHNNRWHGAHGHGAHWRCAIVGKVGQSIPADSLPADVTITGPVDDIRPWLQAADAGLNPMRSGSGSNIKLAETLAAGLPAITTPFGLRGYEDLAPWVQICEIEDFARAINDTEWPNAIPEAVIHGYSWATGANRLVDLYQKVMIFEHSNERNR